MINDIHKTFPSQRSEIRSYHKNLTAEHKDVDRRLIKLISLMNE